MAEKRVKTTPKDFFLNLLSIIALYVSATSLGTLLFQYINHAFPDPLEAVSTNEGAIRFAISSLVVFFPVYLWSVIFMQKSYQKEPERKEVAVRKWLVYFTIFAASLIVIGDVVALVMKFLGGELTARFLLKIVAILFIAGLVLGYYFWDLRQKRDRELSKPFAYGVSFLIFLAVAANFFIIGSPMEQRKRLFDDRRVSDLSYLQSEVLYYWQTQGELPQKLGNIRDDIRGVMPPTDPATGEGYTYNIVDDLTFELCANFDTEGGENYDREVFSYPVAQADWTHGAGTQCFTRHIDPEVYSKENVNIPKPL